MLEHRAPKYHRRKMATALWLGVIRYGRLIPA